MNNRGDDVGEMSTQRPLDDASIEDVLRGAQVPPELEPLAGVVQSLRSAAQRPVRPTLELAERMAAGVFPIDGAKRRTRVGETLSKFAAMSLRAKVATGFAAALTGLTAATAAGALPDAAQERVETAIESVTPIDFPDAAEFGQEVAEDAQDGGVDGGEISEWAREQGQQPEGTGHQGKADEHRPAGVPDGPPTALPIRSGATAHARPSRPQRRGPRRTASGSSGRRQGNTTRSSDSAITNRKAAPARAPTRRQQGCHNPRAPAPYRGPRHAWRRTYRTIRAMRPPTAR